VAKGRSQRVAVLLLTPWIYDGLEALRLLSGWYAPVSERERAEAVSTVARFLDGLDLLPVETGAAPMTILNAERGVPARSAMRTAIERWRVTNDALVLTRTARELVEVFCGNP
jgi:hypothetical protein